MLGDKIRVGERGDARNDDQIRPAGQLLNERVAGGNIGVGGLGVSDIGGIIEVAERAFDVEQDGVIVARGGQRLPDLVDAGGQPGRGDVISVQLNGGGRCVLLSDAAESTVSNGYSPSSCAGAVSSVRESFCVLSK